MKIKLGLAVAVTLVAGASLVGCSSGGSSSGSSGSVSGTLTGVYDIGYKSTIDPIVKDFEKKYPGVTVKINYTGDVNSVLSTQLQAGTAPDILVTYPGGQPKDTASLGVTALASLGRLLDVTSSSWTTGIPEKWKADVSFKNKVYGYPGAVQPLAAIYNKQELDKLGLKVPTTLDEVYQLCSDATKAGVYAYAQGLGEVLAGPQMMSFGQTASLVYGPNPSFDTELTTGKASYADSAWVNQFKIYKKMYDQGCFGEGSLGRTRQQGAEAVASGAALAQVDVGGQKAIMQKLAPKNTFLVEPIPATNDGKNFVTALPGYTVAINAKAKNPTAAKAFLAFLAEPAESTIYANGFSSVPILPNASYTPPADLKGFADLVSAGKYAKLANLGPAAVQTALNEGVQSLLLGNDTPESVAKKMDAAFKGQ